jgi:hypothetical protein
MKGALPGARRRVRQERATPLPCLRDSASGELSTVIIIYDQSGDITPTVQAQLLAPVQHPDIMQGSDVLDLDIPFTLTTEWGDMPLSLKMLIQDSVSEAVNDSIVIDSAVDALLGNAIAVADGTDSQNPAASQHEVAPASRIINGSESEEILFNGVSTDSSTVFSWKMESGSGLPTYTLEEGDSPIQFDLQGDKLYFEDLFGGEAALHDLLTSQTVDISAEEEGKLRLSVYGQEITLDIGPGAIPEQQTGSINAGDVDEKYALLQQILLSSVG